MSSRNLYFPHHRLSPAELSAARIDGHVVELGEGYIPADAIETTFLRAASLAVLVGDTLAATHASAAWVHGALHEPPVYHEVQRAVPRRIHHVLNQRLRYRDGAIDEEDLVRIGGVRVTTPARTLADLARGDAAARRVGTEMCLWKHGLANDAVRWLRAHPYLPRKRGAITWLESAPGYDEVTR